jgi:cell division protein FtsQ
MKENLDIDEIFDIEEELKKKKPKIRFFRLLLVFLILGCLIALFTVPSISRVRHIKVIGNKFVTDDEIIKATGLYDYPNYYGYFPFLHEKDLDNDFRIEELTIKRKFGFVVEIVVDEATPVVFDLINSNAVYSNLGRTEVEKWSDYPLLINETSEDYLLKLVTELEKLPSEVYLLISEIEYAPTDIDNQRFRLYMSDQNTVYITLPTLNDRLKYYNDVTKEIGDEKGILFLDVGAVTSQRVQVVFRKYEDVSSGE